VDQGGPGGPGGPLPPLVDQEWFLHFADVPSVHASLGYGYFFLVLSRFQLLFGMRKILVDLYPREKGGSRGWVG